MAKFSLPAFFKTTADIATAQMQGQQEGQQAQIQQALQAAQAETNQRNQQNTLMGKLPLDEASQALFANYAVNQPSPYLPIANLPGVSPAARAIYRGAPQPAVSPLTSPTVAGAPPTPAAGPMTGASGAPAGLSPAGGAAAPASGRSFRGPGRQTYTLKGVTDKEKAAFATDYRAISGRLNNDTFEDDPNTGQRARQLMASMPAQINTAEDYQRANQALSELRQIDLARGPRAEANRRQQSKLEGDQFQKGVFEDLGRLDSLSAAGALPGWLAQEIDLKKRQKGAFGGAGLSARKPQIDEIERLMATGDPEDQKRAASLAEEVQSSIKAKASPGDLRTKMQMVLQQIKMLSPEKANDDATVRGFYNRAGLGSLVADAPVGSLAFGGAEATKYAQRSLAGLSHFKDMSPADQKAALDNLGYWAKASDEPITIPTEIVSQMSAAQKAELAFNRRKFDDQSGQAWTRIGLQGDANDIRRDSQTLDEAKFKWIKLNGPNSPKGRALAKWGMTANGIGTGLHSEAAQAWSQYRAQVKAAGIDGFFDPEHPNSPNQKRLAGLYWDAQKKSDAYHTFFMNAWAEHAHPGAGGAAAGQPGAAPQGGSPTPVPKGMTPDQAKQMRQYYIQGMQGHATPGQINAFLRNHGLL